MTKDQVVQLGDVFRKSLRAKMDELYRIVPMAVLRRHILNAKFGVTTNWYDYILQDPIQYVWSKYVRNDYLYSLPLDTRAVDKSSWRHLAQLIPYRTFQMDTIVSGTLVWRPRGLRLNLTSLELRVLELSSGKLDLLSMRDRLLSEFGNRGTIDSFDVELLNFLQACSDQNLVVFRKAY